MLFFKTRDGTCLAYEDHGSGPPIVLVAGGALNADMWEYQVPCFLERRYRCVLPDRRGMAAPTGRPAVMTSTPAPMTWPR